MYFSDIQGTTFAYHGACYMMVPYASDRRAAEHTCDHSYGGYLADILNQWVQCYLSDGSIDILKPHLEHENSYFSASFVILV